MTFQVKIQVPLFKFTLYVVIQDLPCCCSPTFARVSIGTLLPLIQFLSGCQSHHRSSLPRILGYMGPPFHTHNNSEVEAMMKDRDWIKVGI